MSSFISFKSTVEIICKKYDSCTTRALPFADMFVTLETSLFLLVHRALNDLQKSTCSRCAPTLVLVYALVFKQVTKQRTFWWYKHEITSTVIQRHLLTSIDQHQQSTTICMNSIHKAPYHRIQSSGKIVHLSCCGAWIIVICTTRVHAQVFRNA